MIATLNVTKAPNAKAAASLKKPHNESNQIKPIAQSLSLSMKALTPGEIAATAAAFMVAICTTAQTS